MNNIILVGFMGVGKSTISRELSKDTGLKFIDTDRMIEETEGKEIKEIFAIYGEEYFRKKEQNLAIWLEKNVSNSIISTGGGFFMVANLKKIGKVVYLKDSFENILQRILSHKDAKILLEKRPLFKDKEKAFELFKKRACMYEKVADLVVNLEDCKSVKEVKKCIISTLNLEQI